MQLLSDKVTNWETKSQHCSMTYLGSSWEESAKFEIESKHPSSQKLSLTQRMMQISLSAEVPTRLLMRTFKPTYRPAGIWTSLSLDW